MTPQQEANAKEARRILTNALRVRQEIDQIFADVAHWNRLHPDEPIDIDSDGALAHARERTIFVERTLLVKGVRP